MKSAGERARDAYTSVSRKARRLSEEIQDVTAPFAVPVELDDEDSMVVAVGQAIAATGTK